MDDEVITRELFLWMRAHHGFPIFPREVGRKINNQVPRWVADELDFWEFWERWNVDKYANIFSQRQKTIRLYDTILFDIDYHNGGGFQEIEKAYEYYVKVHDMLRDAGIVSTRVYFTGRGFHVYVDFPPTRLEFYPKVIDEWVLSTIGEEILKFVDVRVLGDRNRMARLPFSVNSSTGMMMLRIDDLWDLDTIIDKNLELYVPRVKDFDNDWLGEELKDIDEKIGEKFKNVRRDNVVRLEDLKLDKLDDLPPCIREGIERLAATGELESTWRMHIATFLMRVWGVERTVDVFRLADDFNEAKTRYFINYFMEHDYYPLSCKKARALGICNTKKCVFEDLTGGWLGALLIGGDNDEKDNNER